MVEVSIEAPPDVPFESEVDSLLASVRRYFVECTLAPVELRDLTHVLVLRGVEFLVGRVVGDEFQCALFYVLKWLLHLLLVAVVALVRDFRVLIKFVVIKG